MNIIVTDIPPIHHHPWGKGRRHFFFGLNQGKRASSGGGKNPPLRARFDPWTSGDT